MTTAVEIAALTGLYALVLGSVEPPDLLTGAVVSAIVLAFAGRLGGERPAGPLLPRAIAAVPWLALIAVDVARGTAQVAAITLWPGAAPPAGIVAIPIGDRSEEGVAMTGLVATISPGEVMIGVDWDRGVILLHEIDARDPDAIRARHDHRYRRHQRRVFP